MKVAIASALVVTVSAGPCASSEYCCPDAKACLTPSNISCAADDTVCGGEFPVCCPVTKLCVKPGNACESKCEDQVSSYCCPDAKHCLKPKEPGTLCGADADCGAHGVCCPLTKLCVAVEEACDPDDETPTGAMPTKEIASNVSMPIVSIGTWVSGSTTKKENATEITANWLDLGFRGIDTAYIYFDQTDIAAAIAASGIKREELFITSKIPACESLTAESAVNYDLNKLSTDYIDLMLIHAPVGLPGACPATWKVLEKLVGEGKLRSIGVSNFKPAQLQKIMDSATIPIAVNQIEYNVFSHDEDTIAFCDAHNITIEAWSPLGGAHGGNRSVFSDPTVGAIAKNHNVSAAQVALRWIVQRGHTIAVLSGNKDHQANDADLFNFKLSDDEVQQLTTLQDAGALVI